MDREKHLLRQLLLHEKDDKFKMLRKRITGKNNLKLRQPALAQDLANI